jgi:rRNA maturation RNase YbeY
MRITIANHQKLARVNKALLRPLVAALADNAQKTGIQCPWRELTIILVDDTIMPQINQSILRHQGTTDVITQRYAVMPGEPAGLIGEIYVNIEQALRKYPRRQGWSPQHEVALYIAHGCDHLNDESDADNAGRRRMRQRELRWLRSFENNHPRVLQNFVTT